MKRQIFSALAALLWVAVTPGLVHADDTLKRVQQSLHDQGFYYGTVDGTPGDETTQAIRRYQIRNGLAVSGQLTEETRTSILRNSGGSTSGGNSSGSAATSTPRPRATPSVASTPAALPPRAPAAPSVSADDGDQGGFRRAPNAPNPPMSRPAPGRDDDDSANYRPGPGPRPDLRAVPPNGVAPSSALTSLFADTAYEFAPPPVQSDTLRRAQNRLLRQGFYDREPDGRPNAVTVEALTNFQGVNHLRRTGRLDNATLAALHLSPGRPRGGPQGDVDEEPRRGQGPGGVYEGRVVR